MCRTESNPAVPAFAISEWKSLSIFRKDDLEKKKYFG